MNCKQYSELGVSNEYEIVIRNKGKMTKDGSFVTPKFVEQLHYVNLSSVLLKFVLTEIKVLDMYNGVTLRE